MVRAPVFHPLLDLRAILDPLGYDGRDQVRDLIIGSETQADELLRGQPAYGVVLFLGQQIVKAQALLEADDPVLSREREEARE